MFSLNDVVAYHNLYQTKTKFNSSNRSKIFFLSSQWYKPIAEKDNCTPQRKKIEQNQIFQAPTCTVWAGESYLIQNDPDK